VRHANPRAPSAAAQTAQLVRFRFYVCMCILASSTPTHPLNFRATKDFFLFNQILCGFEQCFQNKIQGGGRLSSLPVSYLSLFSPFLFLRVSFVCVFFRDVYICACVSLFVLVCVRTMCELRACEHVCVHMHWCMGEFLRVCVCVCVSVEVRYVCCVCVHACCMKRLRALLQAARPNCLHIICLLPVTRG